MPKAIQNTPRDLSTDNVPTPAVRLNNVSKVYRLYDSARQLALHSLGVYRLLFWRQQPQFREFHALRDIDLTIMHGERVGIIGRNGAGKTTLLKLLTGNFRPTTGAITVNGTVQALMQTGLGFHPEFSGYENIRSSLLYNGLAGRQLEEALEDVIEFAELGEFLHQPMKTYSLGMTARVQFAAATAIRPDILIIDEVLGAGDAYFSGKSAHRMQKLTSSGCTLLLVSHSMQQVLQFCERAIWLEKGVIKMQDESLKVVRAYEEFIEHMAYRARNRRVSIPNSGANVSQDFVTPDWQKERMAEMLIPVAYSPEGGLDIDAKEVSRWPSEKGLKITGVWVLDETGKPAPVLYSGRALAVEIEVIAEESQNFKCRFSVLVMTLQGVGVCRHLSDEFHFALAKGQRQTVRLSYTSTLFASGEFVFSAAVFKYYDPDDVSKAVRYDLLSRSFRLKVVGLHDYEPGLFYHPAHWKVLNAT